MTTQVFCNPELNFAGRGALRDLLAMHHIAPQDAFDYCAEIHFDDQGLSVAGRILGDLSPEHPWQRRVQEDVAHGRLAALQSPPNPLWQALAAPAGKSRIGGAMPRGLVLPEVEDFASGHGYVGTLSQADPAFAWLPGDIHLIWPFFCDFHPPLFLDITNLSAPKLISRQRCALLDADTGDAVPLDDDLPIEESDEIADLFADAPARPRYEPYRFDMVRPRDTADFGQEDGVFAGVPIWVQYPQVPLDPETGSPMRFVCQVTAQPRLVQVSARPAPGSIYHPAFEKMDFWGAGVLFVFISDTGRTLCLLAQNS